MRYVSCSYCAAAWTDNFPDPPNATIWCGDCDRSSKHVGAEVRFHDCEHGWRFGKIIGLHFNADGIAMATIRFSSGDCAVPLFRFEVCEPSAQAQ